MNKKSFKNKITDLINTINPNKIQCLRCNKWFNTKYISLVYSNQLKHYKICDKCWEKRWKELKKKYKSTPLYKLQF